MQHAKRPGCTVSAPPVAGRKQAISTRRLPGVTTCYRSPIFQARCARAYRIMLSSSAHVELNGTQTWRWRRLRRMREMVFPQKAVRDKFANTVTSVALRGPLLAAARAKPRLAGAVFEALRRIDTCA